MLVEYRRFLMRGNALDLAVGVVAGATFGAVVNSLVGDVVTPLIAAVIGQPDFSALVVNIGDGEVRIGEFLNALITFVLTMSAIFFLIVKPLSVATERFLGDDEERHGPSLRECPECLSDVPAAARRCAQCCVPLAPKAERPA